MEQEIINSYPKTFTVPEGAVKFKVVVHDKSLSDLPVIDPQLEKGNRVSPFRPSFKDVPRAVTYLTEALQNNTTIDGGLVATTLIKVGAKQVDGVWEEKAGINGAGTNPATPTFWGGGSLDEAVNTVANGTGSQAPFVVTRDGRIFAYAGYIGGFQLIDEVLSTDSLEMGIIDGFPKIKVRDQSQGGREAVVIGDIAMTPTSALSGGGNIDVVPALVTKVTESATGIFYITQSGFSQTQAALSTSLSQNTTYSASFDVSTVSKIGNRTFVINQQLENYSSVQMSVRINIKDGNGIKIGSQSFLINKEEITSGSEIFTSENPINIQFATTNNGTIYATYEFTQQWLRVVSREEQLNEIACSIKSGTHIIISSGKGSIEIGRGFQAIFGAQKYFKIEDKAGVPFIQSEGTHEHNGCEVNDLLLGVYAIGATVTRWKAHKAYTSASDFTLSKVSAGIYKLVHNLQTKSVISGIADYRPVIYCGGTASSVVTASITGNEFNFTTGSDTDQIFIQIWSLKGWNS